MPTGAQHKEKEVVKTATSMPVMHAGSAAAAIVAPTPAPALAQQAPIAGAAPIQQSVRVILAPPALVADANGQFSEEQQDALNKYFDVLLANPDEESFRLLFRDVHVEYILFKHVPISKTVTRGPSVISELCYYYMHSWSAESRRAFDRAFVESFNEKLAQYFFEALCTGLHDTRLLTFLCELLLTGLEGKPDLLKKIKFSNITDKEQKALEKNLLMDYSISKSSLYHYNMYTGRTESNRPAHPPLLSFLAENKILFKKSAAAELLANPATFFSASAAGPAKEPEDEGLGVSSVTLEF